MTHDPLQLCRWGRIGGERRVISIVSASCSAVACATYACPSAIHSRSGGAIAMSSLLSMYRSVTFCSSRGVSASVWRVTCNWCTRRRALARLSRWRVNGPLVVTANPFIAVVVSCHRLRRNGGGDRIGHPKAWMQPNQYQPTGVDGARNCDCDLFECFSLVCVLFVRRE